MKIKETFVGYTGSIDVGRYCFFIDIDQYGAEVNINDLAKQAIHFPRIVLIGEPFEQKQEVSKLIKKIINVNLDTIIEINTNGTIRPTGITTYNNVIFNVILQLKNSGKQYENRIKESVINWFNEAVANFKFYVNNEDDVDEANLIVNNFGIKRKQVYLSIKEEATKEQLEFLIKQARLNNYNFTLDYDKLFWRNKNDR